MSFDLKEIDLALDDIKNTIIFEEDSKEIVFEDESFNVYSKLLNNEKLNILKDIEIIKWLLDDTDFLLDRIKKNNTYDKVKNNKTKIRKLLKQEEDIWGLSILEKYRPDIYSKNKKNWTNTIGELIGKELMIVLNKNPSKPKKVKNLSKRQPGYCLDLEIDEYVIECKTSTFFTDGTANEKILGTPFKYCEVPSIFKKPLKILCIANAEKYLKDKFGIFTDNLSQQKLSILNFYKNLDIEFLSASNILLSL